MRIAFFTIAAIHVVFIGGLLMQGCKKPENKTVVEETSPPPLPPYTNDVAYADPTFTNQLEPTIASNTYTPEPLPPPLYPEPAREYVVAKGDSFYSIAKKSNVSMKAIADANPGVNSSRLKIGQKLQLPAPGSASASPGSAVSPAATSPDSSGTTTYVVKSGDMLEKIARRNGTTAKAIMRENNLRTTLIKVGQKLKIPSSKSSGGAEPVSSSNYVTPLPSAAPTK